MTSFAQELVTVDRERLDLRAGLLGLAVLAVFGVAIAIVGPVAMAAAIGALVVLATDPPPAGRSWATALLPLVVGGAVLTFVAVWIDGQAVPAALIVGLVGSAATLHGGRSRKAGVRGLIATLWIILALTLHDTGVGALEYAVAFAAGGAVGASVASARARSGSAEGTGTDDLEAGTTATPPPTLSALLGTPLGQFAVLRGIGLAFAVLLGFTLFPAHPAWLAITSLIVMRPPTRNALVVGLQTPIMAYFPLIVIFAARYDRRSGIGTVIALMLPYFVVALAAWTAFYMLWYALGLPWGI